MKYTTIRILLASLITSLILATAGCNKDGGAQGDTKAANQMDTTDPGILLSQMPASAVSVGQARAEAVPGQEIVVAGQVGGSSNPISDSYASFILADEDILFCNEMEDHGCKTPWDACCEDPDKLSANRASVVFLDEAGQPRSINLREATQLDELDRVALTGIVAPSSTPDNLIIYASGLYRIP